MITEQLAEISDQGEQLDGMSITAEGNAGNFWLGNTWINPENIASYQDQLNQWADAFTESADLLLYSCFTALGEVGEGFVQTLATATGLDVAASTNATGSANHSGDWELEYRTGEIELENPFMDATLSVWEGKLATFTVTAATQAALEAAIVAANGSAGADEIRFSGVTRIDLTSALSDITDELTITGGDTNVTIAGNNTTFRIFNVTGTVAATFDNLTITGGRTTGTGGGINSNNGSVTVTNSTISGNSSSGGGGINSNNGSVTVTNSTVSGNSSSGGGGINSFGGGVTVTNSTVSGNSSSSVEGGGIFSFGGGVTVTNSTISGNSSNLSGGGILSYGDVTVTNSTISGNSSNGVGGGIVSMDSITVTQSTISGNSSNGNGGGIFSGSGVTATQSTISSNSSNGNGGGINSGGSVTVTQSTISGNSSNGNGGGINSGGSVTATQSTIAFNSASGNGGGISAAAGGSLGNTIVSNNSAGGTGQDLFGTFTANYNLILDPSGATISGSNNIFGQDPLLQPLADNGGPTQTHAIAATSPAVNAGSNEIARLAGLTIEIFGGRVDLGAYELNPNNDVAPFTFAELFINPLEDTENLTDEFLRTNSCQTIPEIELEKDDDAEGGQIAEDLDATSGIDLDEDCLPINDSGGGGDVSAVERLMNPVARRR
ncbi:MAG: DUF4347 domain-containing protein [Cyanobacteria bacterium P01_G01_bin.54]